MVNVSIPMEGPQPIAHCPLVRRCWSSTDGPAVVVVRINDRGPFIRGRIIDLSLGAALAIGLTGVAEVSLVVLH